MKRKFEITYTILTRGRKVVINTFHLRRGALEDALFDGYRLMREFCNNNYDVYFLEQFECNEVSINE